MREWCSSPNASLQLFCLRIDACGILEQVFEDFLVSGTVK